MRRNDLEKCRRLSSSCCGPSVLHSEGSEWSSVLLIFFFFRESFNLNQKTSITEQFRCDVCGLKNHVCLSSSAVIFFTTRRNSSAVGLSHVLSSIDDDWRCVRTAARVVLPRLINWRREKGMIHRPKVQSNTHLPLVEWSSSQSWSVHWLWEHFRSHSDWRNRERRVSTNGLGGLDHWKRSEIYPVSLQIGIEFFIESFWGNCFVDHDFFQMDLCITSARSLFCSIQWTMNLLDSRDKRFGNASRRAWAQGKSSWIVPSTLDRSNHSTKARLFLDRGWSFRCTIGDQFCQSFTSSAFCAANVNRWSKDFANWNYWIKTRGKSMVQDWESYLP